MQLLFCISIKNSFKILSVNYNIYVTNLVEDCNILRKEFLSDKIFNFIMYKLHKYRLENCIIKMTKSIVKVTSL